MVNSKIIGGIIGAIVIIGIVFAMGNFDNVSETSNVTEVSPEVTISDSATLEKGEIDSGNNPNYSVGDDGVKRYTISAKDSPDLGD